ncbi:hypothetical protein SMA75_20235 [Escherichia coli]|uniref:hypothetical protein n=1 Tax=Escherichia coli TaxID=562 RepID=UPI00307A782E
MGKVVRNIFGGVAKVTNKMMGIDPEANKQAIEDAANKQAEATRQAAETQAAAAKQAADQASQQARQQAESANMALQQSINQQQTASQIRDQTKPVEEATVDLTAGQSEEDLARKRNPRAAYQGGGSSGTGIRLS